MLINYETINPFRPFKLDAVGPRATGPGFYPHRTARGGGNAHGAGTRGHQNGQLADPVPEQFETTPVWTVVSGD